MSLIRDAMGEAQSIVNDVLGNSCTLTDTYAGTTTPANVVVRYDVELYQDGQFAGMVTTAVFDRSVNDPKIGNELLDHDTGITYQLDGVKVETPSKLEFILGEL
jgi:hypothetical protein